MFLYSDLSYNMTHMYKKDNVESVPTLGDEQVEDFPAQIEAKQNSSSEQMVTGASNFSCEENSSLKHVKKTPPQLPTDQDKDNK